MQMMEMFIGFGVDVQFALTLLRHSFAVPPMANTASELPQYSFGAISKVSDCTLVVEGGDWADTPVDDDIVDASVGGDGGGASVGGDGGGEEVSTGLNIQE